MGAHQILRTLLETMMHGHDSPSFILQMSQPALILIFFLYSRGVHLSLLLPIPVLIRPCLNYTLHPTSHQCAHQNRIQTASPDHLSFLTSLPGILRGEGKEEHGGPHQRVAGEEKVGE